MDFFKFLSEYGILAYGIAIFFGGRWGLKYFTYFKQTKYNFLAFATVAAGLFILGEVLAGTFKMVDFGRYFITFAIVTSCYEWVSDFFPFLKPKKKTEDPDANG